jgi:O-antigen/teichoic acid export membrane protein
LILAARRHADPPVLLSLTFGIPAIAPLILLLSLIREGNLNWAQPITDSKREAPYLLHTGRHFLIVQIGVLVNNASEAFLIAVALGPAAVALYSVAQKPFLFCSMPVRIVSNPLWGSYADAYAQGDRVFLRNTLKGHTIMTVAYGALAVGLTAIVHRWLVGVWSSGQIDVPASLTIALAISIMLDMLMTPLVTFMNGCGRVKPQVSATVFSLFTYFPIKVLVLFFFGLSAMVWCTIIFMCIVGIIFYGLLYRRSISQPLLEPIARFS